MFKIRLIIILLIGLVSNHELFSQNDFAYGYNDGQLFIQTKLNTTASFKESILKDKAFGIFKVESIERAFKINDGGLERVFLVKFLEHHLADALINKLNETNYFEYVEKVPKHHLDYTPNDLQSTQWNLKTILAEKAWDIQKGSSKIIIAIVDDAMDTAHQDLESVVWRNAGEIRGNGLDDDGNGYVDDYIGWDCADNDNNPTPGGNLRHGTHCSGIAGASTNNNTGIASIAFGCKLMIAKIGQVGNNYLVNAYQGVEYAIINKANVISMSWGGGGYSYTEQLLFDNAFAKGIVCVAAAGNSSNNYLHYPSAYNHVIAVGSTTSSDKVSNFSNYGTWVDVMAPGSSIYSTLLSNTYGNLSGTSMATPLVSGLCGLMFSKNPKATPTEIENCLKSGCDNIDNLNSNYIGEMGAGRINAENSLKCLKAINADFTSNYIQVCPGDTIKFLDLSKPVPLSVKWLFPGGTPNSSLVSNPQIKYSTAGVYDVTLIVFGSGVSDTIIKKNYITIAKPKAILSGNRSILLGSTTTLRIDFTGNAPYSFKISDGTVTSNINNILYTPYYYSVSPLQTTTYTLTAFSDKKCTGNFSGTSIVTISSNTNCTQVLKYQANIGGSADDQGRCVTEDAQGNIIVSGFTKSYGNGDVFLTKFNKNGSIIWFKTYGGNSDDAVYAHIITKDNGYLLLGAAKSYTSTEDALVIKVDSSGAVQWSKTIAGSSNGRTYFQRAVITSAGDYILGGATSAYGAGLEDNYLVKISSSGTIKWTSTYGNTAYNVISGLASFADGSIVYSSGYRDPSGELLIAKTDSMGSLLWSKRFGGANDDAAYDLTIGKDGNVYLVGAYRPNSNQDICVASFTPNGTIRFIRTYGGSNQESAYNVKPIDDDILIAGYTQTYGNGGQDGFIMRLDTAGKIISSKAMGGTSDEIFIGFCATSDGGFYTVGSTTSFTNGGQDIFLNKLNCKLEVGCNEKAFTTTQNQNLLTTSITQSVSSGGSFTSQSITAVSRSLVATFLCKTEGGPSFCPKVENLSKISNNSGSFGSGLDDDDRFGSGVNGIGDIDKDGIPDMAVCADSDDDGSSNTGAIWILFMNKNGTVKSKQKISATQGGFSGSISGGTYFGVRIVPLGDLDKDGVDDIAVSNHFDGTVAARSGCIWILFLNSNGTVKSYQKITTGVGGFTPTLQSDDRFGIGLENIGDFDGDGVIDIAVGAQEDQDGGSSKGAFYLLMLNTNGTVKSYKKISSTQGGFTGTIGTSTRFGFGIANIGDLNLDGVTDLVVSSRDDNDGGTARGALWVLFMNSNGRVKSHTKISSSSNGFSGLDDYDNLGQDIKNIGDLDADGLNEIVVSCPWDDDGGTDRGAIWIVYFKSNGTIKNRVKINSINSGLSGKIDNSDVFGYGIGVLNDIDKDGYKEIVGGAMWDDDGGNNRGAVYIMTYKDTCATINKPKICKLYPKFTNSAGCVLDSIQFKDLSTDSLKNSIIKWEWNFGDGSKIQGTPTPKHLYSSIGNYTVKLVVSNSADNTCKDSISKLIKVDNNFNIFALPNDTICIGDSSIVGVSTEFCGTLPFTYQWTPAATMANSNISNSVVFPTQSTYYSVVVTDKFGKKAYDTVFVKVDSNCCKSFAHFNLNKTQLCLGDTAIITNVSKSKPGDIFNWKISPAASIASYTGTNIPNIVFNQSGIHKIQLILQDVCGNDTVVHQVYVKPKPVINAGRDTALCLNDTLQLGEDAIGRNTYAWIPSLGLNDAAISNPQTIFKGNIKYILKMLGEDGCRANDTVSLTQIIEPKLFLGNDTSLCVKDSIQIKSNIIANTYMWNNGNKNNLIYLKKSGTYWLKTKLQCMQSDTITINFLQTAKFSLGNDTIICGKNTTEIKPNISTSGYGLLWDDNTTASPRTIVTKGQYWLRIKNSNCESFDTINVDFSKKPFVNLGKDTILCNNALIDLDATDINAKSYLWNDGVTQAKRTINGKGTYSVELKNVCGTFTDAIKIDRLYDVVPRLGKDTTICIGDTLVLNAAVPNTNFYKWNDNTILPTKKVFDAGKYTVEVGNFCGNFDTSINITTKNCDCNIYMPNVFSPKHTTGTNDLLMPIVQVDCEPTYYKMQIFDRWGAELFSTTKTSEGWNGEYENKLVPNGVYVWILTVQQPYMNHNIVFKKTGSVLILE